MTLYVLFFLNFFNPALGISFTNIKEAKGSLYIGIYNCETDFLKEEEACLKKIMPVKMAGNLHFDTSELPAGTYAISCFHDLNGNGKLDANLLGIPSEPYGFSNNVRPKFRAPNWNETKFEVNGSEGRISVRLEKW